MEKFVLQTHSSEETISLGRSLGAVLPPGTVVALIGDLGTGKTHFTKGLAQGMGISRSVTSPTFVLIRQYDHPIPLYHVDLYRLRGPEDTDELGLEELFYQGDGVVVVEWAGRILDLFPEEFLQIDLAVEGENRRKLTFSPQGKRYVDLLDRWQRRFLIGWGEDGLS